VAGPEEPPEPRAVAVRWVGKPDEGLEQLLSAGIAASAALSFGEGEGGLLLYVRTTGRLVEAYDAPEPVSTPHLLLDVAYHHTVSLGPLVVAGETACLACLAGRIGQLWGDSQPPSRPAMLDSPGLAAALAVRELEKTSGGDVRLAGATAAYDFDSHQVNIGAVYRLPWCPVCGDGGEIDGRIELAWDGSS
jgi:bacteriocin biosynthesis cyclodehydratase domain-containing protein